MRKLNNQNIDNLNEIFENNKIQIRINSKDEIINLFQLITKYRINFDIISIFLNDTLESYIKTIVKQLSTDKVSVSEHNYIYIKLCLSNITKEKKFFK